MFLVDVTVTPSQTADDFRQAHLDYLKQHAQQGTFLLFGPYLPKGSGGLIIAQAESKEALQAVLSQDPYAMEQCAKYEIREFSASYIHENFSTFQQK